MNLSQYFSPDYHTARRRFVSACQRLGAEHRAIPIRAPSPTAVPLTIDIGVLGSEHPSSALVLSSGLHGVEGFFGSAVQLAFLERLSPGWRPPDGAAIVLLHSLNPFGFAWRRRFNEENVDLNRNFLLLDELYSGAPPLTGAFRSVLSPSGRPWRLGSSSLQIGYLAMRHGLRAFWETVPVGQYEFKDWLSFGGHARSQCAAALEQSLPPILDSADEVVHLDFHTGLGRWGIGQLLLPSGDTAANISWWKRNFGADRVPEAATAERPYEVRGGLGEWLQARFPHRHYRFATAEFGTYSPYRMLRALIAELRFHTRSGAAHSADHWSRRRLSEAFVPKNPQWRAKTLTVGIELTNRAMNALWPEPAAAATSAAISHRNS
jgi:Protein of unknown function (DUF2817)